MKKLLLLMSLLATGFSAEIYVQPLSEKKKLFQLSNEAADFVCDATQSHLKDLALLLVCGAELKNHPIELMSNSSDQLTAVSCGSSLTIYCPFFSPSLLVKMRRFDFELKEDEKKSSSEESESAIELTAPLYTYSHHDQWLNSWSESKTTATVEPSITMKFSPQEFGELLKYCARRKPNTSV